MTSTHAPEKFYFDPLKESRGEYFVEYHPPRASGQFATLNLVFLKNTDPASIAAIMEKEALQWLSRYKVPLMVKAFDEADSVINIVPHRPQEYLTAWITQTDAPELSWKSGELDEYLKANPVYVDYREIYRGVSFRTELEVKNDADKYVQERRKQIIVLKAILIFWLAVIPAVVGLVEYFGPNWLAVLVLFYTLWKAYRAWQKLLGHGKPSKREQEDAEKKQKMEHYYYHCERNPAGFSRLMVENLDADIREDVRAEAERIAAKTANTPAERH